MIETLLTLAIYAALAVSIVRGADRGEREDWQRLMEEHDRPD